jgi:hypothetical protein
MLGSSSAAFCQPPDDRHQSRSPHSFSPAFVPPFPLQTSRPTACRIRPASKTASRRAGCSPRAHTAPCRSAILRCSSTRWPSVSSFLPHAPSSTLSSTFSCTTSAPAATSSSTLPYRSLPSSTSVRAAVASSPPLLDTLSFLLNCCPSFTPYVGPPCTSAPPCSVCSCYDFLLPLSVLLMTRPSRLPMDTTLP